MFSFNSISTWSSTPSTWSLSLQHGHYHIQDGQVTDCVPDSSNAVEAEEEADDEQHSSGSVDEVTRDLKDIYFSCYML